ncbi:hypothetical protein Hanom_Chr15g01388641 [Helianthus anomalus]
MVAQLWGYARIGLGILSYYWKCIRILKLYTLYNEMNNISVGLFIKGVLT